MVTRLWKFVQGVRNLAELYDGCEVVVEIVKLHSTSKS